jgi:deoxyribonuclease V
MAIMRSATMRFQELHDWDISPAEARAVQADLARRVELRDALTPSEIKTVAGVDNAYVTVDGETLACAAVVVLAFPDPQMQEIETVVAWKSVTFPYVPGLLSFREAPAILAACAELTVAPDVFLFDGQGYAHPRRLGLASHLGVILDAPAIGCAKSRLIGQYEEPAREFGASTPLVDRGEVVGAALRTRPRHKPLFVSPGHKLSVEMAVAITLACCRNGAFIPEPTRLAHVTVTRERRRRQEAA